MTPADISSSPLIQSPAFVFKKVRWRLAAGWPLRLAALLTAILIYGAFSSPTPEALGPAEIAVGMLLFMAAGGPRVMAVFWQRPRAGWARAGQALLFYGLSVPVIVGLFSGSTAVAMVRDVIPFLFMLLPLFLQSLVPRQVERRQEITIAVMLAGLGFAGARREDGGAGRLGRFLASIILAGPDLSGQRADRLIHRLATDRLGWP